MTTPKGPWGTGWGNVWANHPHTALGALPATVQAVTGSRLPLWGMVSGLVVGVAVAVGLVAFGPLDIPRTRDLTDARSEFLQAWERSRNATVVVRADFERRRPNGEKLTSPTELVQRPPDRLVRQFGGVSGEVGGHPIVCSTDAADGYRCFPGTAAAPPYDQTVQRELATLRTYFEPPRADARPLYRTVRGLDAGCFELFQQVPLPDPPYGTYAKFCYDGPTGARTLFERHFESGNVELERAVSIEPRVTDGDFDTTTNEGFDQTLNLDPSTTTPPGTDVPPATAPVPAPTVPPPSTTVPPAPTLPAVTEDGAAPPTGTGSQGGATTGRSRLPLPTAV